MNMHNFYKDHENDEVYTHTHALGKSKKPPQFSPTSFVLSLLGEMITESVESYHNVRLLNTGFNQGECSGRKPVFLGEQCTLAPIPLLPAVQVCLMAQVQYCMNQLQDQAT